ncbi:conserved protein of unknown function [Petrocella atlantisensis]|uniref:Uncharacterized protein n=1 Tax=Petrocella atlantisensis TaxID=2173034 RepID=A0A3P7PVS0_9FIRM|nr:hypothetical protein [Petrocella atlantisensis]VDN47321.1 conserved protein of unknown function [Petrocella atlantisensis]
MKDQLIRKTRENSFETIRWILGLQADEKKIVKDFVLDKGMKSFLLHHRDLQLIESVQEKIEVLKRVMQKYDGDIKTINFEEVED